MKRILAMLLAVVMVVGLIPATVFAADTVLDAAIFCSDVHGSTSDLTSVLAGVKTSGVDYSSIGFVGDTCLTVANTTSTVQSALGDTDIAVMFSYAKSHDTENSADIADNWDYSGEVEGVSNYYLVYTIRETDMQNSSDAATAAPAFTSWYNGLTAAEKALPIFIMSHRPLHDRRDDNAGAATWYDAISAAAESSDIVFFWAHNHTSESSVDTAAYYVAKDGTETFTVYNGDTVTPNFTYMNAGYINANGQHPARINVATTVQITADSLIFQDYTTSGTYTDASYSHNVTVAREFAASEPAATLESIEVSGTTEYTVGGNGLDLTVTATYDDGTTADVTEEATFEPAELTASGEYTVTASYGEMTDTIDVTVNLYDEVLAADGETLLMGVEAFSQGATALKVTWDDAADAVLEAEGLYTDYVVYDLAVTNPGETTTYSMTLVDNMDTTNLAVYHVAEDGTLTAVPYTIENDCVVFTTSLTGAFAYGNITVPDGYTLQSVTLANIPTDLFVGGSLDFMNAVITATYTKEGAEDFVRQLTVYDYDESNFSGYDVNVAGPYTAVFTFEGVTATLDIHVWGHEFTSGDVTVSVDNEGSEYGVTAVNVAESTNTNVATAIQYVITGDNYVAYDITLTYENGYSKTEDAKTVTLPIPEGVNNPVVYYVSDDGTIVTNMNAVKDGNGNVTFTTTHFSTYVIGESTEIDVPENETATGSGTTGDKKTVYVLTSSISSGNDYLIVNGNSAGSYYALANNSGSVAATGVTVQTGDVDGDGDTETYIELTDATDELWTVGGSYTFQNGSYYLGYSEETTDNGYWEETTSTFGLTTTARSWSYSTNNNRLSVSAPNGWRNTTYYLRYNDGWTWTDSSSASGRSVYFYVLTEIDDTVTVSGTYKIEGEDMALAVSEGTTANLKSTLTFTPDSGDATTTDVSTTATYEIVTVDANGNAVDGDPNDIISKIENGVVTFTGNYGTARVKVSYTTDFGVVTDYITVTATAPYYTINLHKANVDEDGNVTLGDEITDIITRKNVKAGDTYSVWAVIKEHNAANPEGTDLGDVDDSRIYWTVSDESIATIDTHTGVITFTGTNYGTITVTARYLGEDGKTILCEDSITISVSATSATVPSDGTDDFPEYPDEGAVRHDKTATAVGNFSETGIAKVELSMTGVPYTTGSEIDVVVMLDMSTSMDDDRIAATVAATKVFIESIVKNEDDSYNANRIYVGYFNGDTVYTITGTDNIGGELASVDNDTEYNALIAAIEDEYDGALTASGTNYDVSLEECYNVLTTAKTDGTGNDRQQFVVFMSDGGPTDYATSASNVVTESTVVDWFDVSNSDSANWTNSMTEEYWSSQMKDNGVTIYSVGLILQEAPTSGPADYRDYSADQNYYVTSTLLTGIASGADYFFNCESATDTAEMENIFANIAKNILAAATDVTVADKIGSNYTMVFDAPNAVVDAADGGQEYYIEVIDYELEPVYADDGETITDYTRGTATSLLKLYFGYNESTGYYAATDADGTTKAATPVFEKVTLGEKGTKFYWTTDSSLADADAISVVGADSVTYYFYSAGMSNTAEDFDSTKWYNMTSGAYASGTNTTVTLTDEDGNVTTSATCQNMIIASPYFVYDAESKMLIWTIEEISSSEMTLTYFLYLNNSGGFSGTEQEIDPATYTTNQFAYVNYTNFNGNECQLDFPVPQMTWNGAQVSYVFYLVNAAGLPVNRAGRVVPFSEAVYVTDVYTYAIIWNDLEQSAGLDADRLAAELVPEVYELYDNDAAYSIHVYEDTEKSNLNNHFVISGDVTDADYSVAKGYTNAKTTYVFNTKADANKYNVVGAYVADDEDNTANESGLTYWCKDYNVTGTFEKTEHVDDFYGTYYTYTVTSATYDGTQTQITESTAGVSPTGASIIDGKLYYVDSEEKIYTIVAKNDGNEVEAGFDFSNTTVAFAVVWKPQLVEDVVVIDYGLDVVIDVIANDGMAAGVTGVMMDAPSDVTTEGTYDTSVGAASISSTDGLWTASKENLTAVRFHMNEMGINAPVSFYYEAGVNYYPANSTTLKSTNMYSKVTVIPATTVYYEDSFVTYTGGNTEWTVEGTTSNKTQAVDRPGVNKLSDTYDADNVYGYDAAYDSVSTYSMGSAHKIHVDANSYGNMEFSFWGTGFDVISMTSSATGTLVARIFDADGNRVANKVVDTYYGYNYGWCKVTYTYTLVEEAKEATDATEATEAVYSWVKTNYVGADAEGTNEEKPEDPQEGAQYTAYEYGWYPCADENALYQVPVIQANGLDYGYYKVTIIATYAKAFDHTADDGYDLYLDAIRIYDPTGDLNASANDAYKADNEANPNYTELRNNVISASNYQVTENEDGTTNVTGDEISGLVFIDGKDSTYVISDYVSYGPNNELYLAPGQAIAFNVTDAASAKDVQLGIKLANGGSVTYAINDESHTVSTAADMYYSILKYAQAGTVVIENVSGGILSLTNIKVTYAPAAGEATSLLWMDGETANFALMSLRRAPADTDDSVSGDTTDTETEDTVTDGNTNTGNTTGDNTNTEVEDTVTGETNAPEVDNTVTEGNGADDTTTNEPAEDVPVEEIPEEDTPAEEETTEQPAEQLGFWARLWNAIKNAFNRLFSWFGF